MGLKHTLTHTHYYVYKTYGRDSRSQEIGTSRESRDRCHLLRARIRHADVDQFVYQRQRLIFKGIYQHHRRVDYVVRHAGRLDRAKDDPKVVTNVDKKVDGVLTAV